MVLLANGPSESIAWLLVILLAIALVIVSYLLLIVGSAESREVHEGNNLRIRVSHLRGQAKTVIGVLQKALDEDKATEEKQEDGE